MLICCKMLSIDPLRCLHFWRMRNHWQAEASNSRRIKTLFYLIHAGVMPGSYCAPGCTNRRIPGSSLSLYRIPSGDSKKKKSIYWNGLTLFIETNGLKKKSELIDCAVLILYQVRDSSQLHSCKMMHKKQQLAKVFKN